MKDMLKAILAFAEAQKTAFTEGAAGDFKDVVKFLAESIDDHEKAFAKLLESNEDDQAAFMKLVSEMKDDEDDSDSEDDEDDDDDDKKKMKKKKETDDSDSDDDDDKKKMKSKSESVDLAAVKDMLAEAGVDDEHMETFSVMLKQLIVEAATKYAEKAEAILEKNYAEKLAEVKTELEVRVESYAAKAATEFSENHAGAVVDSNRLTMLETLLGTLAGNMADFNFETTAEDSSMLENLRADSESMKTALDEATDKLHESRNVLLLERCEKVKIDVTKGMADGDSTRLLAMVEDLDFTTSDEFKTKVESLRDKFFLKNSSKSEDLIKGVVEGVDYDASPKNEAIVEEEDVSLINEIADVLKTDPA